MLIILGQILYFYLDVVKTESVLSDNQLIGKALFLGNQVINFLAISVDQRKRQEILGLEFIKKFNRLISFTSLLNKFDLIANNLPFFKTSISESTILLLLTKVNKSVNYSLRPQVYSSNSTIQGILEYQPIVGYDIYNLVGYGLLVLMFILYADVNSLKKINLFPEKPNYYLNINDGIITKSSAIDQNCCYNSQTIKCSDNIVTSPNQVPSSDLATLTDQPTSSDLATLTDQPTSSDSITLNKICEKMDNDNCVKILEMLFQSLKKC